MMKLTSNILIGGASHTGKSTFAAELGEALGRRVVSTDSLARHPGRPWPKPRSHVAEFYRRLSGDSIFTFLLHRHENMWPGIKALLEQHSESANPLIVEGSALRPEYLSTFNMSEAICFCLTAPEDFLSARIRDGSNYENLSDDLRYLVDVFIERTLRDNQAFAEGAVRHEIACIDVSIETTLEVAKAIIV